MRKDKDSMETEVEIRREKFRSTSEVPLHTLDVHGYRYVHALRRTYGNQGKLHTAAGVDSICNLLKKARSLGML